MYVRWNEVLGKHTDRSDLVGSVERSKSDTQVLITDGIVGPCETTSFYVFLHAIAIIRAVD